MFPSKILPIIRVRFQEDKKKTTKNTSSQRNKKNIFFLSQIRAKKLKRTRPDQCRDVRPDVGFVFNGSSAKLEKFQRARRCLDSGQVERSRQNQSNHGKTPGISTRIRTTHKHTCVAHSNQIRTASSSFLFFLLTPTVLNNNKPEKRERVCRKTPD